MAQRRRKLVRPRAGNNDDVRHAAHLRGLNLERMLTVVMDRSGPFTRAELTRATGFSGVDGAFRLLPDGGTDRALAILEVQKFGAGIVDAPAGLATSAPPATSALPRATFNLN